MQSANSPSLIKGAGGFGTFGISGGIMGNKSSEEQKLDKKKSKAAIRNELEKFNELNWESKYNAKHELSDSSMWTTVDEFTKKENTLNEDIEMLKVYQKSIKNVSDL